MRKDMHNIAMSQNVAKLVPRCLRRDGTVIPSLLKLGMTLADLRECEALVASWFESIPTLLYPSLPIFVFASKFSNSSWLQTPSIEILNEGPESAVLVTVYI